MYHKAIRISLAFLLTFLLSAGAAFGASCGASASPSDGAKTISLVQSVLPYQFEEGEAQSCSGLIVSDGEISSVTISVLREDGTCADGCFLTGEPSGESISLSELGVLPLETLPAGSYTLHIEAAGTEGEAVVLMDRAVTVTEAAAPEEAAEGAGTEGEAPVPEGQAVESEPEGEASAAEGQTVEAEPEGEAPEAEEPSWDVPEEGMAAEPAEENQDELTGASEEPAGEEAASEEEARAAVTEIMEEEIGTDTGEKYWESYFDSDFRNSDRTPWCGTFVAWVYDQAGQLDKIEEVEEYGNLGYVPSYTAYANENDKWVDTGDAESGDIIIFGSGRGEHVGLVLDNDGETVTTVEGNSGPTARGGGLGAVARHAYDKTAGWIKGVISVL